MTPNKKEINNKKNRWKEEKKMNGKTECRSQEHHQPS